MVLFTEMFTSELIGNPVVDRFQEIIGSVKDIFITLDETFPKVVGLLVKTCSDKKERVLLLSEVELVGKKFVATKSTSQRVVFTEPRENEIRLERDIIDKQIVDIDGARIIRVNDLKLAMVNQNIRLIAADVGFSGFLRRLGVEGLARKAYALFKRTIPETLIGWDHVEPLKTDFAKGVITIPHSRISELHPADVAHIISQVQSSDEKTAFFASLNEKTASEALHELEPQIGAMILMTLDTKKALGILEKMPIDEAADVLGDLPFEKTEEFLRLIRIRRSAEIRKLLKHKDETAGGLMTTEYVTLSESYTVEQTIQYLRETVPAVETIYYLYIVDEQNKLKGVLSLRSLIINASNTPISEIMMKDVIAVYADWDQRKVADVISKYNLLAVPVIDENGIIQGIITVDDVIDFILPPISRRKREMLG